MKQLIFVLFIAVNMAGCAALFMAPYDTNENLLINKVVVKSEGMKDFCGDYTQTRHNVTSLFTQAKQLKNFSHSLPNNELTTKMINPLYQMIEDMHTRYKNEKDTVSKTYCELKFQSIHDSASTIQKAIAKRPRP
jgi:hypothetical protein